MENFKEVWRPMVGFEGFYEISNIGNVESLNYHREKCRHPLKKWLDKNGYVFVIPYKDGEPHKTMVHRAVAMAFIPNPNDLPMINHKDENPQNNSVDNLEWCTAKYNTNYGTCLNRGTEKRRKQIIQKDKSGNVIATYESMKKAESITGLQNISKACRGIYRYCGGFIWEYKDEETRKRAKHKSEEEKNKKRIVKQTIYQVGVLQYTIDGIFIKEFSSINEAFVETGINRRAILENCRGTRNSTHKFVFKYKNI